MNIEIQRISATFTADYSKESCTVRMDDKGLFVNGFSVLGVRWIEGPILILETEQAVHFFYPTRVLKLLYWAGRDEEGECIVALPDLHILLGIKGYNGRNLKEKSLKEGKYDDPEKQN